MVFFTSDLHIGHDKDFIWKPRGFNSIEEHDTAIIDNWNKIVGYEDTVYILGDLCLGGNEEEWDRVYKALKGDKYFLIGNHDTIAKIKRYEDKYFMYNLGYAEMYKYNKKRQFYLSHYPTIMGNYDNKTPWNLSGHTHNKNPFQYGEYGIYNVSLDAHNNTPISIETIIKEIERYKNSK